MVFSVPKMYGIELPYYKQIYYNVYDLLQITMETWQRGITNAIPIALIICLIVLQNYLE